MILLQLLKVFGPFAMFVSPVGAVAIFDVLRLPSFGLLWWLIWAAMFVKWRTWSYAYAQRDRGQRSLVILLVTDVAMNAYIWGVGFWQLYKVFRP